jgi:hypothetical protein
VPALAGQQRPSSPATGAVVWAAVIVLAIAITIVPVPHRTTGRVGLEQCVGHLDRVENQRIIGTAQAEANELENELVAGNTTAFSAVVDRHDLVEDFRPLEDLHR